MRSIGMPELLILWLTPAILSGVIAWKRGGSAGLWSVLGFVSGPLAFAVLILAFALNHHKLCLACRKRIDKQAIKCPYCRTDVSAPGPGVASE